LYPIKVSRPKEEIVGDHRKPINIHMSAQKQTTIFIHLIKLS